MLPCNQKPNRSFAEFDESANVSLRNRKYHILNTKYKIIVIF